MKKNPIGIIDSGIGGVSVWKEIVKLLPQESTLYLSDAKHLPYGEKSEEEVYHLAKRLLQYMVERQVKLIVIACNTITVSALEHLRADFSNIPIVGTVPVVKSALRQAQGKQLHSVHQRQPKIGILSTKRTAESEYVHRLIREFVPDDVLVVNLGTNELVPIVESGNVDQGVLHRELQPFINAEIDTLALGCTHFPFLKKEIQQIMGEDVLILDSGEAVARQVQRILKANNDLSSQEKASHEFLTTGDDTAFTQQVKRLVGISEGDTIRNIEL